MRERRAYDWLFDLTLIGMGFGIVAMFIVTGEPGAAQRTADTLLGAVVARLGTGAAAARRDAP
jgi:hypothetical protein